jgi:hypothetical protein
LEQIEKNKAQLTAEVEEPVVESNTEAEVTNNKIESIETE